MYHVGGIQHPVHISKLFRISTQFTFHRRNQRRSNVWRSRLKSTSTSTSTLTSYRITMHIQNALHCIALAIISNCSLLLADAMQAN